MSLKNFIIPIIALTLYSVTVNAQNYTRAIGLRGGSSAGVVYRHYVSNESVFEGILGLRQKGMKLTILKNSFEKKDFRFSRNIWIVTGYGGHIGWSYTDNYQFLFLNYEYTEKQFSPIFGIDAYAGLEYRISDFPLTILIDYKPFFEFSTRQFFNLNLGDVAFSFRYFF